MNRRLLYPLFMASLVSWVLGNGLAPLLPVYASQLGSSPGLVGYYLSISYLAVALGSLTAGWWSNRLQRRKIGVIVSGSLNVPAVWLIGKASNAAQLTALTAFVWFMGGFGLTLISILAGLLAEKDERGRVFGILALTSALGALIGGLTIGAVADRWGYSTLFVSLALFACLLPLIGFLLQDRLVAQQSRASGEAGTPAFGSAFYWVLLASLLAAIALFVGRLATSLAMHQLKFSSAAITSTAAIGGLVALPLAPLVGRLSDGFNRKLLLVICSFLGACGLGTLAISVACGTFTCVLGAFLAHSWASDSSASSVPMNSFDASTATQFGPARALCWLTC